MVKEKRKCDVCGVIFEGTPNQKYCSIEHRNISKSYIGKGNVMRRPKKAELNIAKQMELVIKKIDDQARGGVTVSCGGCERLASKECGCINKLQVSSGCFRYEKRPDNRCGRYHEHEQI